MLYSGNNKILNTDKPVSGQFIDICGERFYEIQNYDKMQPFFISLASDTDLWMYLASTGGLTAGRRSPGEAMFPYYTDDKITEQYEQTGPKTILRVVRSEKLERSAVRSEIGDYISPDLTSNSETVSQRSGLTSNSEMVYLWEPFSQRQAGVYDIVRKISKSTVGNKIVFCEENLTLGLRFSYMWSPAGKHGWVRRATLENLGENVAEVELLDGLQNVLPAGVERKTQNEFSTLVDGYKKTELVGNMALFRMEAILVDRAEPSESLRCNTIYNIGLDNVDYLVSSRQLDAFRCGEDIVPEQESKGVRGAIFAHKTIQLDASASATWYFVADVEKDAVEVRELLHFLSQPDAAEQIENAIAECTEHLKQIVGQNDGIEHTADEHTDARHFANTLFNTMRGGYYLDNYNISGEAFLRHVKSFNKQVAEKHNAFLESLPDTINRTELQKLIEQEGDPQLMRLFLEYLPITFGRRHGDPSRPWNLFNIRVQDEHGKPIVSYQGNWRDIFQNWEALSVSYPDYINGIISKFLNATTVDGYNPYKVTSEGIDWEVIEPENPWSNIGYWGDHQIIYLLKLLELSYQHDPEALRSLLGKRLFAFANVPYRFKSYEEIVADPKNTIRFDDDLHKRIFSMLPEYGQDARLVLDQNGEVLLTTFEDKLFITLLAKLSNFIPEAGIWMNTLRPEWNDANNALVGYGASMVTLCYLRRYVSFLKTFLQGQTIYLNLDTAKLLYDIEARLRMHIVMKQQGHGLSRLKFINGVGKAGEEFRTEMYKEPTTETFTFEPEDYLDMLDDMLCVIDESIRANKREDGLYNAYNLIQFKHVEAGRWEEDEVVEVSRLYPMLEGQVAVLTSGLLTAEESVELLDAMRRSDLYREDQRSYMLYPARRRKSFLEMNNLPQEARKLPVVKNLLGKKQNIIIEDLDGGLHFNGSFNNADFLEREAVKEGISRKHIEELKALYEQVFNHKAFTGRSGTFYKYEGLGCIYWHMVSKLLLAVGETIAICRDRRQPVSASQLVSAEQVSAETLKRLQKHYYAIQEGIGAHKQPQEYGSFPFDPYSHTPSIAGVQQPGMTGQVKEDILNRWFELGLCVKNGELLISPFMLRDEEFINGELCFTYCAVPFVYKKGDKQGIDVEFASSDNVHISSLDIPADIAKHLFARDGQIKQIIVTI